MRFQYTFPHLLFILLFCTFSNSIFAQQNPRVQLDGGRQMRAPLELPKGASSVSLCGLVPGNSYLLIAAGAARGLRAEFEIAPSAALENSASAFSFLSAEKNAARFTASAECAEILIKASSAQQGQTVPMHLSVHCETCPDDTHAWLKKVLGQADQAVLEVQGGQSAEYLVKNVLVGGDCFQISNVTYEGQPDQIGTFSNGLTSIGFNHGIIMTNGPIDVAPGPNNDDGAGISLGTATPDSDLEKLTEGGIFDKASIEFDFVPTQSQVVFEFVFASEEYCEFVGLPYNDVFGFFISGPGIVDTQNIALVPSTSIPITINNLNHQTNADYYVHNTLTCDGIVPPLGPAEEELQYDGFTKKMLAVANVVPCQTYHIKIAIGNVIDGGWDSAVFLRANSFDAGGGAALASPAYHPGLASAYEGCLNNNGSIRFVRDNSDASQPLTVSFNVGGTAIPNIDYTPLPNQITIPAGATELLLPVNILNDALFEGQETILLTLDNACSCTQSTLDFLINDHPPFSLSFSGSTVCQGDTAILMPTVGTGLMPYSYHWSTGESTSSIATLIAGTYSVTVKDGCGVGLGLSSPANFILCNTDCFAETFIKIIGEPSQRVRGYGVFDSKDGNLYITGLKQDSALLIKMTPAGAVLWMRTFNVQDGAIDNISEIIVDSEGMVVGVGQSGDLQSVNGGFVFRYNPATNIMQWINTFGLESPNVFGLMELANGNYLIYDNPNNPSNDNRMLEITRPDGTIDIGSPLSQKINLGERDHFSSATIHNGKLYGTGLYTNGNGFANMRNAISRIDLATGNVDWTRLFHIGADAPAPMVGKDLLIEDDHIISVSFGDEIGAPGFNNLLFLQKTDLAGNLVWLQSFDILDVDFVTVDEVISVPDGFVLYARGSISNSSTDLYLIKTDKDGVLQWAKKVDYGFREFVGGVDAIISPYQSQILLKDNHLFFIAATQENGISSQMLIAKTTLDGTVEGDCDFIKPISVANWEVLNPINLTVVVQKLAFSEVASTIVRMPKVTNLLMENQCEVFVNDTLNFSLCFGESVTIDGIAYNRDTTFMVEILGSGGCDTLRTYIIDVLPRPMLAEAVALCPGGFVIIDGQTISLPGTYILSLDGMNGECDTIVTYTISSVPYQTRSENISLCPGQSVTIGGQSYNQAGTVIDTIPAAGGACDTIVTYTLSLLPYQTSSATVSFCAGESVTIGGQVYNQPGTVIDTIPGAPGCDIIATFTLTMLPYQTSAQSISLCPGESVTIGGQAYNQPGIVLDTMPSPTGCDAIITYTLTLLPYQTRSETRSFCPGESVIIGGQSYNQSGTVIDTIPSATGGCDTIVTYTLTLLPYQTRSETRSFCPGNSVTIGGQSYNQPGTVIDTIPSATGGCDTIVTYTLTLLPQPSRSETIAFCPGETITLGGTAYMQPGTVVLALPSAQGGCDTVATYTLQFLTPAPSNVSITCPNAITVGQPGGNGGAVVNYNQPTASTDCICPGIALSLTNGLPSGSKFPPGTTAVCYTAKDSCGQSASCCFNITVEEDDACDTKVNGCVKYELLTITEDVGKNRTYRIRVTNNCSNKLLYTAIQVPSGLVAVEPANFSTYTAPSGNTYKVRSPNFSPQYSVRYSAISDGINLGESDIFKYTLPAQAQVTFIHIVSRLAQYVYVEAHLNTFYCPIGITPGTARPNGERDEEKDLTTFKKLSNLDGLSATELFLFPNPTSGELFADFSPWLGERLNVQVLDSRGQRVHQSSFTASEDAQVLDLPSQLPSGLYFLEALTETGEKHTGRFVIQR